MIEQLIKDLIEALNANTAALAGGSPTTTSIATTVEKPASKGKSTKGKAEAEADAKPEHTQEEVTAALVKIKDDFGIGSAREILKKWRYEKMGDIKPEHFDAIFAEAEKLHAGLTAEADAGEDDDSGL